MEREDAFNVQKRTFGQENKKLKKIGAITNATIQKGTSRGADGNHDWQDCLRRGKWTETLISKSIYSDGKLQDQACSWVIIEGRKVWQARRIKANEEELQGIVSSEKKKRCGIYWLLQARENKRREEFMKRINNLKARFSVIGPGKSWQDQIK